MYTYTYGYTSVAILAQVDRDSVSFVQWPIGVWHGMEVLVTLLAQELPLHMSWSRYAARALSLILPHCAV